MDAAHRIREGRDVAAIVETLKERARAHPWVPIGIPPRQHYHSLPDGLSICFTLDISPLGRYWHLSIARMFGRPTVHEVEFWRHAFLAREPEIERPGRIADDWFRHFYWRAE